MKPTATNCLDWPRDASNVLSWLGCAPSSAPHWAMLLPPALVVISIFVAVLAVLTARAIAREKATLDLIEKAESSDHYRAVSQTFSSMRLGAGFSHLHASNDANLTAEGTRQRRAVFDYISHFELVAIGIKRGVLDEKLYKQWMHGAFVRDWNAVADFIQRERWKWDAKRDCWTYRPSIYAFYQDLACRWSRDARRLTKSTSPPPQLAPGPTDAALPTINSLEDLAADLISPRHADANGEN